MPFIKQFEKVIIRGLIILLALVIGLSLIQVTWNLLTDIFSNPKELISLNNLFDILSSIFMVLIGIELLETVKLYLQAKGLHVELILDVALIALARKVIVLDYTAADWRTLVAMAALILALGVARYLKSTPGNQEQSPV